MTKSASYKQLNIEADLGPSAMDYISLMKPRVMSLVVFTALCGLLLAPGAIHPVIAFTAILCITIGSGSAAALNMWYDRDIDAVMKRTQRRPLVTGVIEPEEALSFGVVTGVLSIIMMALCVNLISASLLAFTILYYIFIYTIWLKRSSIWNVVIGGAAGALPPMIGWAAVTGGISWYSFTLFAIIFIWTPPHSWALALYRLKDYQDCSVPMLPVMRGTFYTKIQILIYSLLMLITSSLPYFLGMSNLVYLVISTTLGLVFLYYVIMLFSKKELQNAKKLFYFSILYLFSIFLCLIALIPFIHIS